MNIVVIEDELHNLRMLQGMVQKIRPSWTFANSFDSVKSSVDWLSENPQPDLILMDIQLADGSCFSIFEKVEVQSPVIFTTAYDMYAIKAFKVNSIDYLLKPIKESELELAFQKFERIRNMQNVDAQKPDIRALYDAILKGEKQYRKRFLISGSASYSKLDVDEIAYFYSENRITFAVTFKNKEHIIDFTLENLEEELNPEKFFRANRQYIINIDALQKFEDYLGGKLSVRLSIPTKETITVSRLKTQAFKVWVGK